MSLLIKNIILKGEKKDIFIEGNKIKKIRDSLNLRAVEKIDGRKEKAVIPGLINCHTHAAMSLFRGYGDDLPLKEWLEKKIWPLEKKITKDDVYWGTKLACLEMIESGTTCFNDMYWFPEAAIEAVKKMGFRAMIGLVMIDFLPSGSKENIEKLFNKLRTKQLTNIQLAVAPHSIYTVSKENLIWAKNFAKKNNLILHTHLSETEKEVKDCLKKYKIRPVEYLDKIGFLNKPRSRTSSLRGVNCVLAHSIWLNEKEIKILAKRKCSVVYNPCSNMKLASGVFPYKKMKEAGVNIALGTDGPASNNNLDMFSEMKFASLLQKVKEMNTTVASAREIFETATKNGAKALKINSGEIKEGKLADLILIDLNEVSLIPGHNLAPYRNGVSGAGFISDIVYSASGDCVSEVVCNGKILMRDRKIEGEEKIKKEATRRAKELVK
jgi:5-methylthioadenosine/S-adenosylhomocysteine deaminase